MEISNKFEFDTQNDKCWYWTKNGEKKEVEKNLAFTGNFQGQKYFQLDPENKSFWISHRLNFYKSQNKVIIDIWLKKAIKDKNEPEGIRFIHYQKKLEKLVDIIQVEFEESDEMIKVFDEEKKRYRYFNRLELKKEKK